MTVPSGAARVFIRAEDFDLAAEVAALRQGDGGVGAVVSFIGTVRDRQGPTRSRHSSSSTTRE